MQDAKLIKLSNGETKDMTCEEVYEQFKRFLYKIAMHWSAQYEFNDIYQIACIGFIKAYRTYDITKGILFMTYLATIVNNEILMFNRKEKSRGIEISLDDTITTDSDGNNLTLSEVVADETNYENMAINNLNHYELPELLNRLKDRDRKIIQWKFINGLTQGQIAGNLKVTQSYISRIIPKALNKLKIYYENGGFDMNNGNSHRADCYRYFSDNTTKNRDFLVKAAAKLYGCSEKTAFTYYYDWKKEYMKERVAQNHDSVESAKPVLVGNKPADHEKVKEVKPEPKPEPIPEVKPEPIKAPEPEHKTVNLVIGGILKASVLRGNNMIYELSNNEFSMRKSNANKDKNINISFDELDNIIAELQELKKVVAS